MTASNPAAATSAADAGPSSVHHALTTVPPPAQISRSRSPTAAIVAVPAPGWVGSELSYGPVEVPAVHDPGDVEPRTFCQVLPDELDEDRFML